MSEVVIVSGTIPGVDMFSRGLSEKCDCDIHATVSTAQSEYRVVSDFAMCGISTGRTADAVAAHRNAAITDIAR